MGTRRGFHAAEATAPSLGPRRRQLPLRRQVEPQRRRQRAHCRLDDVHGRGQRRLVQRELRFLSFLFYLLVLL